MKRIYLIVAAAICVCCTSLNVRKSLEDVESYIMERPDSALAVLDSIDRSLLSTDQSKAHHALLYAMALDKNFIDVSDDSIARVAVNYYSKNGSDRHYARSLYYLGIAYYYQGAYDKAILEFTKAEEIAKKCDSLYWGMTKTFQANAHKITYNEKQELNCLLMARDIYKDLNDEYRYRIIEKKLGQLYTSRFDYESAETIFENLLRYENINDVLKYETIRCYAFMKISQSNSGAEHCVEMYQKVLDYQNGELMTYQDYWAYFYALNVLGVDVNESIAELAQIDTSISVPYWQYRISKQKEDYRSALDFLETTGRISNNIITESLNQSLLSVQRDYYEAQSLISLLKARTNKNYLIIISLLAIIIIGAGVVIFTRHIKRKNEEKERYVQYANEIHRQLDEAKKDNYPSLKKKYLNLYKTRFETIGTLYEQYSLSYGRNNAEHLIYEKVVNMVNEFISELSDTSEFETMLNADLDNIIAHLREDIPEIKQVDVSMFCFMTLGFDVTTISHLMKVSMNSVYIRKSRLRQRIESLSSKHKEQFLNYFS